VAIAQALILDPPVILADEPTGNLDLGRGHKIIGLLRGLNRELGETVVIAAHVFLLVLYGQVLLTLFGRIGFYI